MEWSRNAWTFCGRLDKARQKCVPRMKADLHYPASPAMIYDASSLCLLFALVHLFFSRSPAPDFVVDARLSHWLSQLSGERSCVPSPVLPTPARFPFLQNRELTGLPQVFLCRITLCIPGGWALLRTRSRRVSYTLARTFIWGLRRPPKPREGKFENPGSVILMALTQQGGGSVYCHSAIFWSPANSALDSRSMKQFHSAVECPVHPSCHHNIVNNILKANL